MWFEVRHALVRFSCSIFVFWSRSPSMLMLGRTLGKTWKLTANMSDTEEVEHGEEEYEEEAHEAEEVHEEGMWKDVSVCSLQGSV